MAADCGNKAMKIFRITGRFKDINFAKYVMADTKKDAKGGLVGVKKIMEWDICMSPRHGKIPGTDIYPAPRATRLIDDVPICDVCFFQWRMTVEERLDRLEELVVDLRHDLDHHDSNND